ncbi:MAG: hypothetical protein NCA08_02190 [Deltaproteobacteria bacterium]|nr:hypothetical protein [Candidatus Deferrimicrobium borealis]
MKIAIMMRAIDQDSGFRAYTEELVESMIKLDKNNLFLLIYRLPKHFGRFSSYPNVKEVLTKPFHKLIWDQVSVPFIAMKERADIIFNPKFSVPLLSPIPVTMGLQEHGFFTNPEYYEKWDVRYQKFMIPRCARKSAHLFPMSQFILEENRRILGMPLENTTVLYSATDDRFKPEKNEEKLSDFRKASPCAKIYSMCYTASRGTGFTSFYGGKNPDSFPCLWGMGKTYKLVSGKKNICAIRKGIPWISRKSSLLHGSRMRNYICCTVPPIFSSIRHRAKDALLPYSRLWHAARQWFWPAPAGRPRWEGMPRYSLSQGTTKIFPRNCFQ